MTPPTDTPAPTDGPSPTPTQTTYTVGEGDNLYDISLRFGIPIHSEPRPVILPPESVSSHADERPTA